MIGQSVGNYRILKKLGEGGMGAVYLAEHAQIGRKAAIKVLLPQYSSNPEIVQRFFNEARSTGLIRHPGLVDIFDFGQLPNGCAFLAMEFLDGESLSSRLVRERQLPIDLTLGLGRQIASAVGAAHGQNIIHRDLKPDNLFLAPDSDMPFGIRVKVLDFGIAKLVGDPASSVRTATSMIMGTPPYMSPEQCRGAGRVDHRSDVYAVGCISFEMACGRPPFVAEGSGELMGMHLRDAPPSPLAFRPDLPEPFARLILRALEKRPEDRQQSMAELIQDLDTLRRPVSAEMASVESRSVSGPATPTIPPASFGTDQEVAKPITTLGGASGEQRPRPTTSRAGTAFVALGVVAALSVTGYVLLKPKPSPQVAAAPQPPASPATAQLPDTPQRVHFRIATEPAGAEVFRVSDGVAIGKTPYQGDMERTRGTLRFVVKLDHYMDEHVDLSADQDDEVQLRLREIQKTGSAAPGKPHAPTRPHVAETRSTPTPVEKPHRPERKVKLDDPFADQ